MRRSECVYAMRQMNACTGLFSEAKAFLLGLSERLFISAGHRVILGFSRFTPNAANGFSTTTAMKTTKHATPFSKVTAKHPIIQAQLRGRSTPYVANHLLQHTSMLLWF